MEDRGKRTGSDCFFQNTPEVTCLLENGCFIELNPAFETILGYAPENVMMAKWLDYIHPDDREQADHCLNSVMSGVPSMRSESRFRFADHEYRWLEWSLGRDPDRSIVVAAARDIHTWKELEITLQEK